MVASARLIARTVALLAALAMLACTRAPPPRFQRAEGAGASSVHRDPLTGRFGPPRANVPARAGTSALSSSAAGLTEQASPAGGFMVRLQGRFRSEVRATRAGDGGVTTACIAPLDRDAP